MKQEVISAIEKYKIIGILRGIPKDKLLQTAEALYAGGIRLLEITYHPDGCGSDADTAEQIGMLARHFAGRMFIGAGTVLTEKQVELTKEAGGLFCISPNTDEKVIEASNRLGLVSIPGGLTPTEIVNAHGWGADFVKLFPVSSLGPAYVKAVKAPLSHIKLLAVGGIEPANMEDYLKAGVCGFGIGSNIADKKLIGTGDWAGLTALAEKYTAVIGNG